MNKDDEDYSRFDPKAFWAIKNGEEMEFSLYKKSVRERQLKVLTLLMDKPRCVKELASALGIRPGAISNMIKHLRLKGCEIDREITSLGSTYVLVKKPNVLK